MNDQAMQHTQLTGMLDYCAALDDLAGLARHNLYYFEKNFDGLGFETEARCEMLRQFLLSNSANRIYMLAHDTHYLATSCARINDLAKQFSHCTFIHQTPRHLQHITEPVSIADDVHYVRRFHFDDMRGVFARNDPTGAMTNKSKFMEMWAQSQASNLGRPLGL